MSIASAQERLAGDIRQPYDEHGLGMSMSRFTMDALSTPTVSSIPSFGDHSQRKELPQRIVNAYPSPDSLNDSPIIVRDLDSDPHTGYTPHGLSRRQFPRKPVINITDSPAIPSYDGDTKGVDTTELSNWGPTISIASQKLQTVSNSSGSDTSSLRSHIEESPAWRRDKPKLGLLNVDNANNLPIEPAINSAPPMTSSGKKGFASLLRWNSWNSGYNNDEDSARTSIDKESSEPNNSPIRDSATESLETELRQVSTDLALSIKREMDLEEQIQKLKNDLEATTQDLGTFNDSTKSSDYFSEEDRSITSSHNSQNLKEENKGLYDMLVKERNISRAYERQIKLLEESQASKNVANFDNISSRTESEKERQELIKRVEDAEAQRDALKAALRQLREKQTLERARGMDRPLGLGSPHLFTPGGRKVGNTDMSHVQDFLLSPKRSGDSGEYSPGVIRSVSTPGRSTGIEVSILRSSTRDMEGKLSLYKSQLTQLAAEKEAAFDRVRILESRIEGLELSLSNTALGDTGLSAVVAYSHRLANELSRVTEGGTPTVRSRVNSTNFPTSGMLPPTPPFNYSPDLVREEGLRKGLLPCATRKPESDSGSSAMNSPTCAIPQYRMQQHVNQLEEQLRQSKEDMAKVVSKMQESQIKLIELTTTNVRRSLTLSLASTEI